MDTESEVVDCPYSGERIELMIDPSITEQHYIEDCQVCCRPINVAVSIDIDEDQLRVSVKSEND